MGDLKSVLERGLRGFEPSDDAFERTLRRRDRKRRNQRIAAGVVGIAVFVAAVWIVTTGGPIDRSSTPAVNGPTPTMPPDYAPPPTRTRTRTVEGVTFSLHADRSWTSGPITKLPDGEFRLGRLLISKSIVGPQGAEAVIFWTGVSGGPRVEPCGYWPDAPLSSSAVAAAVATARGTELVSGPTDVTVGGFPAKRVVVTTRWETTCDPGFLFSWRSQCLGPCWMEMSMGSEIQVWIVDVGGTQLFFEAATTPEASDALVREIQQIIGSIRFGTTETGPSVAPDPFAEGGLPPEGATPSMPESGELVVELTNRVWVYADGRVISSVYDLSLEPYSGLVEQRLTPEGVEFLRSNVLATGLFEHDLELASRDNPNCCLDIRVREGDRLAWVRLGPSDVLSDHQAPIATPEQETALRSLEALLTSPTSWPASLWTDQRIRAYVPTSYSFCSRYAEPTRVLALLPEPARDLLGAKYLKADGDGFPQPTCSRMTTEEARALAGILAAEFGYQYGSLGFSFEDPKVPGSSFLIAMNPVLPHGAWAWLAGLG